MSMSVLVATAVSSPFVHNNIGGINVNLFCLWQELTRELSTFMTQRFHFVTMQITQYVYTTNYQSRFGCLINRKP